MAKEGEGGEQVASQLRKLMACVAHVVPSTEAAQKLEAVSIKKLIGTWTCQGGEVESLLARVEVLKQGAAREEFSGTGVTLLLMQALVSRHGAGLLCREDRQQKQLTSWRTRHMRVRSSEGFLGVV